MLNVRWLLLVGPLVGVPACSENSSGSEEDPTSADSTFHLGSTTGGASTSMAPDSVGGPGETNDTGEETTASEEAGPTSGDTAEPTTTSSGGTAPGSTSSGSSGTSGADATGTTSTTGLSDETDETSGGETGFATVAETDGDDSGGVSTTEGGPTLPPLDPLSDEFDDPEASAARWLVRDVVEGTPAQYTVFDFGASTPGALTIQPTASGWFANYDGPYVYTHITGDFMVETEVSATTLDPENPGGAPTRPYNSAGLLLRDPNHTATTENWITHNLGRQDGTGPDNVGTEGKRTRNSASRLIVVPGPNRGRLRMCRVDGVVWLTRRLEGETEFQLTHVYGIGPDDPWPRFDMDEVQIGLSTSGWNSLGNNPDLTVEPDIRAEWSYIRIWRIGDLQACLVND